MFLPQYTNFDLTAITLPWVSDDCPRSGIWAGFVFTSIQRSLVLGVPCDIHVEISQVSVIECKYSVFRVTGNCLRWWKCKRNGKFLELLGFQRSLHFLTSFIFLRERSYPSLWRLHDNMASLGSFIEVLKRELFTASKKAPLKTLLTVLVVYALEKMLTTTNIFKCPKEGYRFYAGMFLFVPAFCLTGVTLLATSSFWNSATSRSTSKCRQKIVCSNICSDLSKAFLVGAAWLIVGFGTTDFYVCFRVGATDSKISSDKMKAQSTMVAWSVLVAIILVALSYMTMKKCCCPKHNTACTIETLQDYER